MCNKKEEISCGKVVAFPNSKFWNNNLCYRHSLEGTLNFFSVDGIFKECVTLRR